MQNTTNYNLNKPDGSDFARIEVLNENFDIIDSELKVLQDNKADGANLTALQQQFTTHLDDFNELLSNGINYSATLLNGWTGGCYYRKDLANTVDLGINVVSSATVAPLTKITQLPAGYRPPTKVIVPVANAVTGDISNLYINDDGSIYLANNSTFAQGNNYQGRLLFRAAVTT